jgi:hypothetical protein
MIILIFILLACLSVDYLIIEAKGLELFMKINSPINRELSFIPVGMMLLNVIIIQSNVCKSSRMNFFLLLWYVQVYFGLFCQRLVSKDVERFVYLRITSSEYLHTEFIELLCF